MYSGLLHVRNNKQVRAIWRRLHSLKIRDECVGLMCGRGVPRTRRACDKYLPWGGTPCLCTVFVSKLKPTIIRVGTPQVETPIMELRPVQVCA